ncbi:MAG: FKBP-type peptidyl-prolyl cis-trans isomerase [Bacteroidota bacterium]|nr:FKBP-type peptidyl-prolyl cis-trans isomerase [Bacteroidota bacterium]
MKKLFLLLIPLALFSCKKSDQPKIDDAIIKQYIADSGLNAIAADSGLYYVVLNPGTGNSPSFTSYVTVDYKGYLTDGTIFDQTAGTPLLALLNSRIKGWQIGLQLIKKGGKIKLLVPSQLGYGDAPPFSTVPSNAVLIFDIELVDFQ